MTADTTVEDGFKKENAKQLSLSTVTPRPNFNSSKILGTIVMDAGRFSSRLKKLNFETI